MAERKTWLFDHCYIKRVIDGDTVVADFDRGLHDWKLDWRIRLAGINAPDKDDPDAWQRAKDFVESLVKPGDEVRVLSVGIDHDQYGRIYGQVKLADGTDLGQALLDSGHAVPD
jgi:endonuclease YncB( thermonuclease family)